MRSLRTTRQFERDLKRAKRRRKDLDKLWAIAELLVHRGVQKIQPVGALASQEASKRIVRRQGRVNLLSAPVH